MEDKKREHLVVLVDSVYPDCTMNGIVAQRIVEQIKDRYKVSIVSYRTIANKDNKDVYLVKFWSVYFESYFQNKIKLSKNKLSSCSWTVLLFAKRVLSYISRNIYVLGSNKAIEKKLLRVLENLNCTEKIDIILSIAAPFELQNANYMYSKKHSDVQSIVYQIDLWSSQKDLLLPSSIMKKRSIARNLREKEILERSKYCMLPFIRESEGREISYNEIIPCQLPLLVEPTEHHIKEKERKNLKFVFAGSLNVEDRNPQKVIRIFNRLNEIKNNEFHIYHRGNCETMIREEATKNSNIVDHGTVSSRESYEAMYEADALVSIGIHKGDQIAGKTFDYLSTGKRIIYFYWNESDINANYLEKYPLALCINLEQCSENKSANTISEFMTNTVARIPFEKVAELYSDALPQNIVKILFEN